MHTRPFITAALSAIAISFASLSAAEYFPAQRVGTITDARIRELSGMVAVSGQDGTFWIHNDSDDTPRIFAITESGAVIGEVIVTGARAIDWEDIAAGPDADGSPGFLHIADTGNNDLARSTGTIYRFREPDSRELSSSRSLTSEQAQAIHFRYPDGNRNAEALVVHPVSGDIYIIAKVAGSAGVYTFPNPRGDGAIQTLSRLGHIAAGDLVTAADVSRDGTRVLVRTYSQVKQYTLPAGTSFDRILFQRPEVLPDAAIELKSESICFARGDRDYLTSNEGNPAPVHRVRARLPQPHCVGPDRDVVFPRIIRGDVIDDRELDNEPVSVDIIDALAMIDGLQLKAPLACADGADVNDDGVVDVDDLTRLLAALVTGSTDRSYPDGEPDLTSDDLCCYEARRVLVGRGSTWSYTTARLTGNAWKAIDFNAGAWSPGATPLGYGARVLSTTITKTSSALFARREFTLEALPDAEIAVLEIDYNDGFVAYLNGVEVARAGIGAPGFASSPTEYARYHRGGEMVDIPICPELLRSGRNVLAIELHNRSALDSSLFFDAGLRISTASPAPPDEPAPLASATLSIALDSAPNVGDSCIARVLCDTDAPFRGFSVALAYDPETLRLDQVEPGDDLGPTPWLDFDGDASRGTIDLISIASMDSTSAVFEPGAAREIARIRFDVVAESPGETTLAFTRRIADLPLDSVVATAKGRAARVTTRDLTTAVTMIGMPSTLEIISGRGEAGDPFFVTGRRIDNSLALEVLVCETAAEFFALGDDQLQVIAPPCGQSGWASLEVRNEHGGQLIEEGFFYLSATQSWIRGDANADRRVDISDAIAALGELFLGEPARARCREALDFNADRSFDISDVIALLDFLFQGDSGERPEAPGSESACTPLSP